MLLIPGNFAAILLHIRLHPPRNRDRNAVVCLLSANQPGIFIARENRRSLADIVHADLLFYECGSGKHSGTATALPPEK